MLPKDAPCAAKESRGDRQLRELASNGALWCSGARGRQVKCQDLRHRKHFLWNRRVLPARSPSLERREPRADGRRGSVAVAIGEQ